jgi:hypothetical protein
MGYMSWMYNKGTRPEKETLVYSHRNRRIPKPFLTNWNTTPSSSYAWWGKENDKEDSSPQNVSDLLKDEDQCLG